MGQRHQRHTFMPGKFVFPGGRMDREDMVLAPHADLPAETIAKLMLKMRGRPSAGRARGLAMAAVRETFEEVGLIVGQRAAPAETPRHLGGWREFLEFGYLPDLSRLVFFARAITPPGRIRRFDSRFFVANASSVANLDQPVARGGEELLTPRWFTFAEAMEQDLPSITRETLGRLGQLIATGRMPVRSLPVTFGYSKYGRWYREEL
jgi:8-oxo-dGTP pyrophosphatase MutT (NUDIX family)